MRDIKFRVWDSNQQKMFYNHNVTFQVTGKLYKVEAFSKEDTKNQIPMQYTGLKDKNGKEIYEGDIIRFKRCDSYSSRDTGEVVFIQGAFVLMIEYKKDMLVFNEFIPMCSLYKYTSVKWPDNGNSIYKIIGNVYENKELLYED